MAETVNKITCEKCKRTLKDTQFYGYRSGQKFELCKQCTTMHIDNFNPQTFTWLLQKMDFPYVSAEWNILRDKAYSKDPIHFDGMSVFGKYISKMKLKQWKPYGWADSEKLQKESQAQRAAAAAIQEQRSDRLMKDYEQGKISQSEYQTLSSTSQQAKAGKYFAPIDKINGGGKNFFDENQFMMEEELPDPSANLTQDDKVYLAMKWGRLYTPQQWLELQKKYTEMENSFVIEDADTISTLILLCKTYLKMNEAVDNGDMDGFQKLSRVYDSLRKSANFTAVQNKEQKNNTMGSIGELAALCQKQGGFIPRYATDIPQDKVDKTLQDMNNYVYSLVTKDLGLGQRIEDQLKKMRIQAENDDSDDFTSLADKAITMSDEDYEEYYEAIIEDKIKDAEVMVE